MPNKYYPNLFKPITIRGVTYRNRILSGPQSCPFMLMQGYNNNYDYSDDAAFFFGSIARGGFAVVNSNHLGVDPRYYLGANKLSFDMFSPTLRLHQIPILRRMTDLIHAHGALASFELNHGGNRSTPRNPELLPTVPGPTAMEGVGALSRSVHEMDEKEMEEIAGYFAEAAKLGVQNGFDIINVHGGHGWLISQFLSPIYNKRTDKYGGDPINRARFPKMILDRIRDEVGDNVPIHMRYSTLENMDGSYSMEESIEIIKYLAPSLDVLQCSVGNLNDRLSDCFTFPTQYTDRGINRHLAHAVKQAVPDLIIDTIGGYGDPDQAEEIIASGDADFITTTRATIADPNWPRKAQHGHADDIRPCLRCILCMDANSKTAVGECAVNPRRLVYREHPNEMRLGKKNVAVIGGGAAGMSAALEFAAKGSRVTLYEKNDRLGGKLFFTDYVGFKEDLGRYRDYLIHQVEKNENITVMLQTEVTPEMIENSGYDAVIMANGAPEAVPPVKGVDGANVIGVMKVFGNEEKLGDRLVVLGGGEVGCETAIHLASLGKHVTIVEVKDEVIKDTRLVIEPIATKFFLDHEWSRKYTTFQNVPEMDRIRVLTSTRCTAICDDKVVVENAGGTQEIPADKVILCAGFKPDAAYNARFEDVAEDVLYVGDALKPGGIRDCTATAYYAALHI